MRKHGSQLYKHVQERKAYADGTRGSKETVRKQEGGK